MVHFPVSPRLRVPTCRTFLPYQSCAAHASASVSARVSVTIISAYTLNGTHRSMCFTTTGRPQHRSHGSPCDGKSNLEVVECSQGCCLRCSHETPRTHLLRPCLLGNLLRQHFAKLIASGCHPGCLQNIFRKAHQGAGLKSFNQLDGGGVCKKPKFQMKKGILTLQSSQPKY